MLVVSIGVVLAGCAGAPFATPPKVTAHEQPPPVDVHEKPPPVDLTGSEAAPKPAAKEPRAENWAAVAHAKPPPPADPHSVVGITEEEALKLLGAPAAITDQAPAFVWQYRGKRCELSLHFYMDVNTQIYRVLTYDVAPKGIAESSCLASVRKGGG